VKEKKKKQKPPTTLSSLHCLAHFTLLVCLLSWSINNEKAARENQKIF
jgi:hypothetical protein